MEEQIAQSSAGSPARSIPASFLTALPRVAAANMARAVGAAP